MRPRPTMNSTRLARRPPARTAFGTTKKDKRTIRHSALVSRIEKSHPYTKKRRRPSKKLITNLESLADALPSVPEDQRVTGDVSIKHKSLKSKPGAMKKKEALIGMERERFNKNMTQMIKFHMPNDEGESQSTSPTATESTGKRWAAIRGFIQQTMEQRPGTRTKSGME